MRTIDPDTPISVQKSLYHIGSEHVACATVREFEALSVAVGIRPHQVSEGTLMRYLLDSLDLDYVIDVL